MKGFLSFGGVIPCSAVHQPYSSSNTAVKFVILGFLQVVRASLSSFIWETFSLLSGFTYSQCANCLKLVFPLALCLYDQVSCSLWSLFSPLYLFPAPGLTLFSANLVLLGSPITLCEIPVSTGVKAHLTQDIVVVAVEIAVKRRPHKHILCFSKIILCSF